MSCDQALIFKAGECCVEYSRFYIINSKLLHSYSHLLSTYSSFMLIEVITSITFTFLTRKGAYPRVRIDYSNKFPDPQSSLYVFG